MFAGRALLAAVRRRRPVARRSAPASSGFQGLPAVSTLFAECDQDRDGRLYGHEAARLAQWLAACAPQEVVDGLFSATGSPQDLVQQDVEHVHAGIRKHHAADDVLSDPMARVIIMHGQRPPLRALHGLDAGTQGAVGTVLFDNLAHSIGGFAYTFMAEGAAYLDPANMWRAHFSMGRVHHVAGTEADVGYGLGTFNEADIERVDILHHATTALRANFDMSSPYVLPYPSEPPTSAGIYPDAWMEIAERIPATGLYAPSGLVVITRSRFIQTREHLPQQYFLTASGLMPPLRIYGFAPISMLEAALRLIWPGNAADLVLEAYGAGGWQRPAAESRLRDVFGSRIRVFAAGHALELNGGQPIAEYNPSLGSRLWGSLRSI